MTDNAGLYLHIPFCEKKCRYCDFYSSFVTEKLLDDYTAALNKKITEWGGKFNRPIDTLYLGGGTPSLLGKRLISVINTAKNSFSLASNAEITLEVNPSGKAEALLEYAAAAGINRLSIGMQSGIDSELKILGRTHTVADTVKTVNTARKLGFSNISLDLMLALPFSNIESLHKSLEVMLSLSPEHISSYILKTEPNTVFYRDRDRLSLPDDDGAAEQYLYMCEYLENAGYSHYEISNFCKNGLYSRHNIKYWKGAEYLGLGPSAHSFVNGKRFYYPRDLKAFIKGNNPMPDGNGGTEEEYIMLSLRLKSGFSLEEYKNKFAKDLPAATLKKCELFAKNGFMDITGGNISLTDKGMLLSNTLITELMM